MSEHARRDWAAGRAGSRPARDADASRRYFGEDVDDASEASFPASDPPAWMSLRVGGPPARRDVRGEGGDER